MFIPESKVVRRLVSSVEDRPDHRTFSEPRYVATTPPLVIVRGEDVFMSDQAGKRYVDDQ